MIEIFHRQEKGVLDKLSGKKAVINVPRVLLDPKKEGKEFTVIFSPVIQEIIKDEGKVAYEQIGIAGEVDLTEDRVVRYLEKSPYMAGVETTKATNKKLKKTLAEGISEGEGIPKLSKRVSGLFKSFERARAISIARTESSRAMNFGTEAAYRQSGVVKGKEWLTAFDEQTCMECSSLDGKIVELDSDFFKKGDKYLGLSLDYENVGHPPLHPRCRCTLIPVVK